MALWDDALTAYLGQALPQNNSSLWGTLLASMGTPHLLPRDQQTGDWTANLERVRPLVTQIDPEMLINPAWSRTADVLGEFWPPQYSPPPPPKYAFPPRLR